MSGRYATGQMKTSEGPGSLARDESLRLSEPNGQAGGERGRPELGGRNFSAGGRNP